jgi:hypothetical protein
VVTNDVEKRWDDPPMFRSAVRYTVVVVVIAGLAFAAYALIARESVVAASTVPAILLVGGVAAFVRTYRVWKAGGAWLPWQGAGWFLLVLMLVALPIPGAAMMAAQAVA